ncbi:uncharacterized protein UTRI_02596_B [Ustilago trichophora]|uniref:Transcription initiation factor TFIID subunit 11 n=1 Tax=Ustilago trichophora TaxID=86804 RepID=A0A5C3E594_9BASI|nr:uncharacterized protein UTRI_02596_B [Ustilago trichophora]
MSSTQAPGNGNVSQHSDMPPITSEGVIPSSFFDMPMDFGPANGNVDFNSMSGFPSGDLPMSDATNFDALTAQIAASMPSMPAAASYPMAQPSSMPDMPQTYPISAGIKIEMDDPASVAVSPPTPAEGSTPKPAATKAKKPPKPKTEGAEAKPKKPKQKKPAVSAATDAAASAESSKDGAAPTAPKPKKAPKKKAADKDKAKDAAPSATASPAPFATPASPSKETKGKSKKVTGSKAGGKGASKARSSTARSASRMSSIGRDAATPATSRVGSQRPQDDANDDEEPAPISQAPQEDEEAEDEEAEADDGVEELGKDHFSTQEAIYAAQQRNMGLLSMVMDEDQLDRHMASRRGALNKTSVRKLVNHVLSQSVSQHVAMVVSGVAKIFVGEIVEKAREIQTQRGEQGPLRPNHLREAHRQYYLKRERPGFYPPGTSTGFPGVGKRRRMF